MLWTILISLVIRLGLIAKVLRIRDEIHYLI